MRSPTLTTEDRRLRADAYRAVRLALRTGELVRPDSCDHCHRGRPDAHHHWGYDEPYRLKVLWLCPMCHASMHAYGRCPEPIPDHVRQALLVVLEWQNRSGDPA